MSNLDKSNQDYYKSRLYVNAKPDNEYPIRILEAYRKDCDVKWSNTTAPPSPPDILLEVMNRLQDERAVILDKALAILRKELLDE